MRGAGYGLTRRDPQTGAVQLAAPDPSTGKYQYTDASVLVQRKRQQDMANGLLFTPPDYTDSVIAAVARQERLRNKIGLGQAQTFAGGSMAGAGLTVTQRSLFAPYTKPAVSVSGVNYGGTPTGS